MNDDRPAGRLGLIGLGALGFRLGARLLEHFGSLVVLDKRVERVHELVALGARAGTTPAEIAAGTDVLLLSLPSPAVVEQVMLGANGLLAGAHERLIVVDTSTLDPASSRRWAAAAAERDACYLDCPVTCSVTRGGGTAAAERGELTFLVGGDEAAYRAVKPVLERLGRRFHFLGPAGSGSVMKLVSNHISGIQTLAIAEALNLARVCGFAHERTLEVCAETVASSYVLNEIVAPRLHSTDPSARFAIELMSKDHRLARELAADNGVELPMNERALELCETMCAAGYAKRDNVACVEYFAGLERRSRDGG